MQHYYLLSFLNMNFHSKTFRIRNNLNICYITHKGKPHKPHLSVVQTSRRIKSHILPRNKLKITQFF